MERRTSRQPVRLVQRDQPPPGTIGTLSAYVAVFNSDSLDLGGYIEQVAPGAFDLSLKANDVVALVNHEHSAVIGRMSAGTLRLSEDDTGLLAEIDLPDTQVARDLKALVERGDLQGCSFGFQVLEDTWSIRDGQDYCTLTRIDLYEVSVGVTFPAYEGTSMKLRARKEERRNQARERYKAMLRFLERRDR